MRKRFPDPKHLQGNGTQYKSSIEEGNVFTTLYDVVVPKMNIQGNHKSIRKFVIDVLPDIYRDVSEDSRPSTQRSNLLPLNTRVKLAAEITYTCDVCDKKYIRKPALKKHIQMKHSSSVGQVNNLSCISSQPIPLPSITNTSNIIVNSSVAQDTDEDDVVQVTSAETVVDDEEIGPHQKDTNWMCSECGKILDEEYQLQNHMNEEHMDDSQEHNEISATECLSSNTEENMVKKLELLERRHEALKEKYDEVMKKNKEYAKDVFKYIKENTDLKNNAEKDAETLADTLSINQVLTEEIKVKDQIIKANEILNNNDLNVLENDTSVVREDSVTRGNSVKCDQCDWTSDIVTQLSGHMLKHTGQYPCDICKQLFKTDVEMKEHKRVHNKSQEKTELICIACDKAFQSEHSFKQHMLAKHHTRNQSRSVTPDRGDKQSLPVGHPQRYQNKNINQNIACLQCSKVFATGREVEDHMTEHTEENMNQMEFEVPQQDKICRYFRKGFCFKGDQCVFKHSKMHEPQAPMCNRGPLCIFKAQNRCLFLHPELDSQNSQQKWKRECRFKEKCWNISSCLYSHNMQGFRFSGRNTRPPLMARNMNTWKDY